MKPYYQDEAVTLYHGDCREVTAWLEADVLVFDPPYGRSWRQGEVKSKGSSRGHVRNEASQTGIANDDSTAVRDMVLELWDGKGQAICFGDLMLPPPIRTQLVGVYRKPVDAGLRGAMGGVRRDLEAIYFLHGWRSGIGGRSSMFTTSVSNVGNPVGIVARSGGHPHAKPLDLMSELLSLTTGTVADPTSGSGPTLVVAKQLGRKAIGVELEERYCEVIAKRLAQGVLDFGASA